ncbi:hypothetical protein AOC36_09645 [Erysipelothrix larvae]|uniref:ParB-like N-terminal domain-containing protein n=1 Tax=Erysipelothrix larvae TaxID=1514105 RepID=A0A0X8H1C8_9FIRM|nr:ParB/RepB/Spo0J family partition protein [Erysipelothrix larvae]AMC94236.1 hypothetical protein AOC36_09645 [Erysipelothrix larvae]
MITQIETYKLVPHPGNPRNDMGDLTELADSIRENGIFQNLTVVNASTAGVYKVIIGHRRLAAAILAGLETVPCAIVDMDEKTQYSTMLLENMQRSDLTPYEQAQGIQQCLDLGMSEADISKKTGFSKKTVKRRLKMLELDQDLVRQSQGTIDDYIALEEIEDIDVRNSLLKHIGTNNFRMEVEKAKTKQEASATEVEKAEVETQNDTSIEQEETKTIEMRVIARGLRKKFVSEVFKNKITPNQVATAVGVINESFIDGNYKNDSNIFNELTNPHKLSNEGAKERMLKNRSNYLVVGAYSLLERNNDLGKLYSYLEVFEYPVSDDEKELIKNA